MTIGTTVIASRWLASERPASSAPTSRSPSRRSARQTSARWSTRAIRSRWRLFISENVASSHSVPVTARVSPAIAAIDGRTPTRVAMRTDTPAAPAAATADRRSAR